jgi:hypothetical protein
MEFPEEIVSIIRTYARPRMQYIHEYNEMVRVLGVEFPRVKKKLETKDADHVMEQFVYYTEAVIMARQSKDAVPVLAQECTCIEHMVWLIASRNYSAYLEVEQLRLKHLEWLLRN